MASFQLFTDPLVTCPYNPAHRLKTSRMQIHLTKCKKNHIEAELKECPYNAQHRVAPSEFQYHLARCEDRRVVERQVVYESNDDHHGNTNVPPYRNDNTTMDDDEVWDLAPQPQSGYDPSRRLESGSGFILTVKGKPSERRNQYQKMFSSVSTENSDLNKSVTSENTNTLNRPRVAPEVEVGPLRKPKVNFEDAAPVGFGRGQVPPLRRKIAANIYGGGTSTDNSGAVAGAQVGFGRGMIPLATGLGRSKPGFPVGHPALAPGQVQFLQD